MGRRNGGGRSLQEILRRRLESCKTRFSTVDDAVNYLRSNYPDYQRTKQQTLTRFVQQALESSNRRNKQFNRKPNTPIIEDSDEEDGEDDESQSASRKRRKKIDAGEDRLQKMEALHLGRIRNDQGRPSTSYASTSSSSSASGSRESDDDDDDEGGSVSTSEDAIYGEKVEPRFDLMKTMLRASYAESKNAKPSMEEKNVELEVANDRKSTKIDTVDGSGSEVKSGPESRRQLKSSVSNGGDVGVKGKDGPKFKDLGGMKEVLEELKMEVIVPLYHPQLQRKLGVKPINGILLPRPPGCGKAKLAHAISNETGLPSY